MSAFAPLTLKDASAADVVFNPANIDSTGVATWLTNAASFDARSSVTMSVGLPRNGRTMTRIKQKVTIPLMDSVDSTKKIGEARITVLGDIPKNCSGTTRQCLLAYANSLIELAATKAAYENDESIY